MKGSFRIRVVVLSTACFLLFIARASAQCVVQAYVSPYDNIEAQVCIVDNAGVLVGSRNYSASAQKQKQDNSMVELTACDATIKQFEAAFQRIHERDQ